MSPDNPPASDAAKPAKKKKPKSAAVSIWATPKDRELYKRISKRAGESLSRIVRTLVRAYDKTGKADGLPTLSAKKS